MILHNILSKTINNNMIKKLVNALSNYVLSIKDGLVEPTRNLLFDLKYDVFVREEVIDLNSDVNDNYNDVVEEKPKKKKKKRSKK